MLRRIQSLRHHSRRHHSHRNTCASVSASRTRETRCPRCPSMSRRLLLSLIPSHHSRSQDSPRRSRNWGCTRACEFGCLSHTWCSTKSTPMMSKCRKPKENGLCILWTQRSIRECTGWSWYRFLFVAPNNHPTRRSNRSTRKEAVVEESGRRLHQQRRAPEQLRRGQQRKPADGFCASWRYFFVTERCGAAPGRSWARRRGRAGSS